MKLVDYLKQNSIRQRDFADALHCSDATVSNLCREGSWTSRALMIRIREQTGGAVTADDFLPPYDPPGAGEPAS